MSNKIANKTKKGIYYKCSHCEDEIYWNTNKKFTECKCKAIYVDGCEDYVRVGGDKKDYEEIFK